MGFDLEPLCAAVARHGRVARVVVAEVKGSAPREVGAAMLVWEEGQSGTIGGGTLELVASTAARARLAGDGVALTRHPLGPGLGQCCGGSVALLTEVYDVQRAAALGGDVVARAVAGGEMPLAVSRLVARARSGQAPMTPVLVGQWFVEPVAMASQKCWIWGAGHVGRAVVSVLAPLPDWDITWIDTSADRFPLPTFDRVRVVPAADMAALVDHAPADARHLILTYSHALDLDLCHRLLAHGFGWAGLIGSETKWARFRSRLRHLGHSEASISRVVCPIGQKAWGKHPQAIAVGVVSTWLTMQAEAAAGRSAGTRGMTG